MAVKTEMRQLMVDIRLYLDFMALAREPVPQEVVDPFLSPPAFSTEWTDYWGRWRWGAF